MNSSRVRVRLSLTSSRISERLNQVDRVSGGLESATANTEQTLNEGACGRIRKPVFLIYIREETIGDQTGKALVLFPAAIVT